MRAHTLILTAILSVGAAGLLSGCASPEARIRKNAELFASFPPAVQETVRQGRADLGFSSEMVRMALGPPARVYKRRTAAGEKMIWAYVQVYWTRERAPSPRWVRIRDADGDSRYVEVVDNWHWRADKEHEYERLRVEFEDDRVTAIETVER